MDDTQPQEAGYDEFKDMVAAGSAKAILGALVGIGKAVADASLRGVWFACMFFLDEMLHALDGRVPLIAEAKWRLRFCDYATQFEPDKIDEQ